MTLCGFTKAILYVHDITTRNEPIGILDCLGKMEAEITDATNRF